MVETMRPVAAVRTSPDSNEYLSTGVDYKNFYQLSAYPSVVRSNRPKHAYLNSLPNFRVRCVMLQGHRYLEPLILGVQRRFCVKRQHPHSQPPHTSNSVQN